MNAQFPIPNDTMARAFLKMLDPERETWEFRTFDDLVLPNGKKRKAPDLTRTITGSRYDLREGSDLWKDLKRLNELGAGIFVTINRTDGRGRSTKNVAGVTAIFADTDGAPLERLLALCPHLVIQSSPGNWHVYWRVSDCNLDRFKPIQQAVAEKFGTDRNICDLPRVMRLPGLYHNKGEPELVTFVARHMDPRRAAYSVAEIVEGLRLSVAKRHDKQTLAPPSGDIAGLPSNLILPLPPETPEKIAEVRSMLDAISPDVDRATWIKVIWALQSTGWECAVELAWDWSVRGEKWNADDFMGVVKSFDPDRADGLHFGTLVHIARAHGWTPDATEAGALEGEIISPGEAAAKQLATLSDFNQRFFVSMIGGGCFIFDEAAENILASAMSEASFKLRFKNVRNGDASLAATWLSWPERRTYDVVDFDPRCRCPAGVFNSYRGLAVKPREGACDLILAHIRDVLCSGDEAQFHYVIRWMALAMQRPWEKPEVALVLRSCEGAGKSIIAGMLLKIFGQHGFTTASKEAVAGRFNGHLRDKIFVVLEEAFFAGDPQAVAAAKVLVTNPVLSYEAKGKDAVTGRNFAHVVMLTNSAWAVPADEDARRWCVLEVSDARVGDHAYFERLAAEIRDGGVEALLDYLLKVDLTGFNPRRLPQTAALADQRRVTMLRTKPVEAWWLSVLADGEFVTKNGVIQWEAEIEANDLRESYELATARNGRVLPFNLAIVELRKLLPDGALQKKRVREESSRTYVYGLSDLDAARAAFKEKTQIDPASS